jgi:hypothetical protein
VEFLLRGLFLSALPWLSVTYVPATVVIAVLLSVRAAKEPRAVLAVMVPATVSVIRRLASSSELPVFGNPIAGMAGLLFDQEFGIFLYAPAAAVGVVGLAHMVVARDAMVRRRGREIGVVLVAWLISAGAVAPWWLTAGPPGRALVPVLPLLALPIAWSYLVAPERSVRRSIFHALALWGVAVMLALLCVDHGGMVLQDGNGSARFLRWLTMLWPAWQLAPAIAAHGLRSAAPLITLWLLAAVAVWWISGRNASQQPGTSALMATMNMAAAAAVIALLAPTISGQEPSVADPEARARLPLLDDFDSVARPHAVIYRPFTLARAADIPPLMTLAAERGLRTGGQPVPVLLNARYALPAGDYAVEVGGLNNAAPVHGTLGLQVGRMGLPMREWQVDLAPGESWRGEFSLAADAEFVGLVASEPLSSAGWLRITPLRIVDRNNRESSFHGPMRTVLSAMETPAAEILFHDDVVYPEKTGFWLRGSSTAFMTVAPRHPERAVTLRVHSGGASNTVTLATSTWGKQVALRPATPIDVSVPAPPRPGPFLLRVTAAHGFIPADITPGNSDRRVLGCWIEVVPQ